MKEALLKFLCKGIVPEYQHFNISIYINPEKAQDKSNQRADDRPLPISAI